MGKSVSVGLEWGMRGDRLMRVGGRASYDAFDALLNGLIVDGLQTMKMNYIERIYGNSNGG